MVTRFWEKNDVASEDEEIESDGDSETGQEDETYEKITMQTQFFFGNK